MAACSDKPKFGNWQKHLDDCVKELSEKNLMMKFHLINCNEERLKFVQQQTKSSVSWIDEYFQCCQSWNTSKCDAEANSHRKAGNKHFQAKQYDQALQAYTLCVKHAVPVSNHGVDGNHGDGCNHGHNDDHSDGSNQELAMGYANRSAVWYRLDKTQACMSDIASALDNGYPGGLCYKLYQRQASCCQNVGQIQEALEALRLAKKSLSCADLSAEKKETALTEVEKSILKLQNESLPEQAKSAVECTKELPRPVSGPGHVLPQASADVRLSWDTTRGRHLMAERQIVSGSVLIVERPFAAVLLPSHYDTHCHHCFTKMLQVIPCHHCTEVGYCSKECQKESWTQYHNIECCYLNLLHSIGIAHLSLRVVLTAGLTGLLELRRSYKQSSPAGLDSQGQYCRNYLTVYELLPHTEHIQPEDLLQYTMTAALLLEALRKSQFFNAINKMSGETSRSEVELYVGDLLLRHICQLVCNAHAITELQVAAPADSSLVDSQSQERVATAIYPTASLMNHSCDPTILSSFHKDTLVVRTVKDVAAGEEIFNCYGPHHCRMSYTERQQQLRGQYFFTCNCVSCQRQGADEYKRQALKCQSCDGPMSQPTTEGATCSACHQVCDVTNQQKEALLSREYFHKGLQQLEKVNVEGALKHLLECYRMRRKVLHRHHQDMAEICDVLARCYAHQGDFDRSSTYLEQSVTATGEIYGSDSVELANELQKYAEVLSNARKYPKALTAALRARKIFVHVYGEQHDLTTEATVLIQNIEAAIMNR